MLTSQYGRRKSFRLETDCQSNSVLLKFNSAPEQVTAEIMNMSMGGLCLKCRLNGVPGGLAELTMLGRTIKAHGAWETLHESYRYLGLEFTEVDPQSMEAIQNFSYNMIERSSKQDLVSRTWELFRATAPAVEARSSEVVREMAYGLAHEIANPLTCIRGMAELVEEADEGELSDRTERLQYYSKKIVENALRVSKILESVCSLYAKNATSTFQSESVQEIICQSLELMEHTLEQKKIELRFKGLHPGIRVFCSDVQIFQVLVNLLKNSCDAIEQLNDRWIEIGVRQIVNHVEISITDSGLGIPKLLRETIMRPFFTSKPKGKGMGLGLVINKRIIENHNGRFELDAAQGNTCFKVILPSPDHSLVLAKKNTG